MANDDYQLYSLLISFFTAFGTISAVIVALYLANKDKKISLKIDSDIWLPNNDIEEEYLFIQVMNNGYQVVYLKNILFRYGIFKKKFIPINGKYINHSSTSYRPPFQKLEVGEIITISVNKSFLRDIYKELLISTCDIKLLTLNIIASTTLGDVFKVKTNREIKKIMKENYE